jgi:hypothetical protein
LRPVGYHAYLFPSDRAVAYGAARLRARAAAARALDSVADRAARLEVRLEEAADRASAAGEATVRNVVDLIASELAYAPLRRVYVSAFDTARRLAGDPVPNRTPEPFAPETFARFTARLRELIDEKVEAVLGPNEPGRPWPAAGHAAELKMRDALDPVVASGPLAGCRVAGGTTPDTVKRFIAEHLERIQEPPGAAWIRPDAVDTARKFAAYDRPFGVNGPGANVATYRAMAASDTPILDELVNRARQLEPIPQAYGSRNVLEWLVAWFRTAPATFEIGRVFPGLDGVLARPPFSLDIIRDESLPEDVIELRHTDGTVVRRFTLGPTFTYYGRQQ